MFKGYTIVIKDYKAEICEFRTIEIINAPDGTKIYHIETKYGEDYLKECDVVPVKKMLEKQCEELNNTLGKSKGDGVAKRYHQSNRW